MYINNTYDASAIRIQAVKSATDFTKTLVSKISPTSGKLPVFHSGQDCTMPYSQIAYASIHITEFAARLFFSVLASKILLPQPADIT